MAQPKIHYTHYENGKNIDLDLIGELVFPYSNEVEKSPNIDEMLDSTKEWIFNTPKKFLSESSFVVTIKSN